MGICVIPCSAMENKHLQGPVGVRAVPKGKIELPLIKVKYILYARKSTESEEWSGRKVYHWLKFELNFKTKGNKNLSLSNIYIILQNSFYYGVFEYPEKSGNWYTGKHEPIVTKELLTKHRSS